MKNEYMKMEEKLIKELHELEMQNLCMIYEIARIKAMMIACAVVFALACIHLIALLF